eukprot:85452-Hanusia_phi.AAC.1
MCRGPTVSSLPVHSLVRRGIWEAAAATRSTVTEHRFTCQLGKLLLPPSHPAPRAPMMISAVPIRSRGHD